mmetsp:Transcript_11545/g.37909  ORF Transcript_11545/g.37909 Transcript_11545/m.37909 type:complete len:262 (-) Transcript_11545:347-1132(-)
MRITAIKRPATVSATTPKPTSFFASRRLSAGNAALRGQRAFTLGALVLLARSTAAMEYYRADGVKILHDPYSEGMAEKYGSQGRTDDEGFDPYADTVGPGIYGGMVKRDADGNIIIGRQYQNHNPRPGPVYSGGGYSEMSQAIHSGEAAVKALLARDPSLLEEISTGGAHPLHICGMSQRGQMATPVLIAAGADIEATDTYGYTPLARMASNNLAFGAEALLRAGANPRAGSRGDTPLDIARQSRAMDVLRAFEKHSRGQL